MTLRVDIASTGDWGRASWILGTAPIRIRRAIDAAVLAEAQFFRRKVVEGFRTQAPGGKTFAPLKKTTLAIRRFRGFGGTKALIVRGDLRNSVKVVKRQTSLGAEAFVGVNRTVRGRDGQKIVNIAEVHEFGKLIVIPVTPAMRRFLMAAFSQELGSEGGGAGGLRLGIVIVKIPARPFIRPVAEKWFDGPQAAARFQGRVAAGLGFDFGGAGTISAAVRRG
jgi:hypothetical protein